ncbi:ArnT family glycosyltransferase [Novilysobacter spongiicola]|uniref:4-amino-4-deoxy-L-arabinose transferase n=1 Tax=Lysobacter spongiicola DSM 21749 TaxID=1122188 RepID=A0A1T4RKA5_9GAMM|nr:glycosyltransferase family 39 protein [Lysobacter spongiicola]SKA16424.1 4-amino-4-deoxy-L-arabinose transferase [Lysobacter spongiicola DSM 21749]
MLALAAIALAAGLGLRDPSPPDEPRFVLAATQMVESGDWLIPRRGSELYAHKPPVFMWLQALAYQGTGNWRVAFLLPSLLASLGTLWLTWDLARRLWNRQVAGYAAFALLATLQFGLQAKRGQIDMVLVFCTTLALWGLMRYLLCDGGRNALLWGGFAAGLGTVTKGVGFLPLLLLLPWWLDRSRIRRDAGAATLAPGLWPWLPVAFLAGVAVWLLPMLLAVAGSNDPMLHRYASDILFRQTGTRYVDAWHHVRPAWYYLQVIATLWLPGALLLPWLLPAWWRRIRRGDRRILYLVAWSMLVLAFFTLSPGKREVYLFPALPAMCIAAAPLLPGLLRKAGVQRTLIGYVVALGLLLAGAGTSALADAGWANRIALERGLDAPVLQSLATWLVVLGCVLVLLACWARVKRAAIAVVGASLLLWTIHGLALGPALDADSSARKLMQDVRTRIGKDAELGLVAWREQHLLQAAPPVFEFGFEKDFDAQWRDAVAWLAEAPRERWLFALEGVARECVDPARLIPLGRSSRREWVLVPGSALLPGCVPGVPEANVHEP